MDDVITATECYGTTSSAKTLPRSNEESFGLSQSGSNWHWSLGIYRYFTRINVRQTSNTTYSATITYKIKDYYDWNQNGNESFGGIAANTLWELNYAGRAKNYSHSCLATITLNWSAGQRLQNNSNIAISITQ